MAKTSKQTKRMKKNKTIKNNGARFAQVLKKHHIKEGSGKKMSRAEALSKLNLGVFGLNWRDKSRSFNYDEEHVIANARPQAGAFGCVGHVRTSTRPRRPGG